MFKLVRIMSSSGLSAASSREVALLTSQLTNIRAEIRHFMDEKNRQIDDLQQRIRSLQPAQKRSVSPDSEANNKRIKTEGNGLDFTVNDGFTEVYIAQWESMWTLVPPLHINFFFCLISYFGDSLVLSE